MEVKTKKNSLLIWGLVAAAAVLILAGALLAKQYFDQQQAHALFLAQQEELRVEMEAAVSGTTFFKGIHVDGLHLAGLTRDEAKTQLSARLAQRYAAQDILITASGQTITIDADSFNITTNLDDVLVQAHAIGRTGASLEENYAQVMSLTEKAVNFEIEVSVSVPELQSVVAQVSAIVASEPQNAQFLGYDKELGTLAISPEVSGWSLDELALQNDIQDMLTNGDFNQPVEAKTLEIPAEITQEDLSRDCQLMGSFQTVAKKDSNRNTNIELSLKSFDGYVLAPGEVFSCNAVIGQRTAARGYKTAGAIRNGVSVQELGGGVCQTSSTLFNAVARAGLEIVERGPHSWPSDYIDAGLDAMIDWPNSDFKFKNNTDANVYFYTHFDWDTRTLTIEIYGKRIFEENVRVELRSERVKTIPQPDDNYTLDSTMYTDQLVVNREGRKGSEWQTYRQFFDTEGNLISEEKYVYSRYNAISSKITVGTKERPAAASASTAP